MITCFCLYVLRSKPLCFLICSWFTLPCCSVGAFELSFLLLCFWYFRNRVGYPKNISLPWRLRGKESACNAGDLASISVSGRFPWRREWLPLLAFFPGEFHGQRSLVGCSPYRAQRVRHDWWINTLKTWKWFAMVHKYQAFREQAFSYICHKCPKCLIQQQKHNDH